MLFTRSARGGGCLLHRLHATSRAPVLPLLPLTAQVLVLAIAVALLAVLATTPRTGVNVPALVAFASVAISYLLVLSACIILCLKFGAQSNNNAEEVKAMLSARVLELRNEKVAAAAYGADQLARECEDAAHSVLAVQECIASDAALEPVRILGFPATYALLQAVLAGSASTASVAFRYLFQGTVAT